MQKVQAVVGQAEANKLLDEGWDLFSVLTADEGATRSIRSTPTVGADLVYVLVKR